jgi:outer membrane protein assembly factor BamB
VVAVDARTGRQVWRTPVPMASVSAPVTGRGLVVVAGVRDCADPHLTVVAVDARRGQPAWQRSVAAENPCAFGLQLRLAGDVVVAGGPNPDELPPGLAHPGDTCNHPAAAHSRATGLDLATGRPRWQAPTTAGAVFAASASIVIAASTSPGCPGDHDLACQAKIDPADHETKVHDQRGLGWSLDCAVTRRQLGRPLHRRR